MGLQDFFVNKRGITEETLAEWQVEFPSDDSALLPYLTGVKGRRHDPDGTRHFWFEEGNELSLFASPGRRDTTVSFIVEGETDAMRLWQEFDGVKYGVYGLSGVEGWKDEYTHLFDMAEEVFVILDNDADYKVQTRVDNCWRNIRRSLGPKARRLYLPKSPILVKDICEFFEHYDIETLRLLAEAVPTGNFHFKPLDLSKPAPPINWLVNNLLAKGDVCMIVGEPGLGKSWLSLALAVGVADKGESWLGHSILHHGRVLYVDEENPEDEIRRRLKLLGLSIETVPNIRYLHHQGIRLDRYPERLIDEAVLFSPELIILDSLTRFHTGDENNAGIMAALFNDGINPLARETGATVVLLHHINKSDATTSFGRARGSGDITASIDTGFDLGRAGSNRLFIKHFKSRRRVAGDVLQAEIVDTPDGGVDIVTKSSPVF